MRVIFLLVALTSGCLATTVLSDRHYNPNEENIDYKRFIYKENDEGQLEIVDLAAEDIEAFIQSKDVTYKLRTRKNPNDPITINGNVDDLKNTPFNSKNRNLFLIHGWVDSADGGLNTMVAPPSLEKENLNVFSVDWSPIAAKNYITAKNAVPEVGQILADFINAIMANYGVSPSKFILVGHSLGAHAAGIAGSKTKGLVDHIIGLDPAAPLYKVGDTVNCIDPTDADYVQILHTNGKLLGFSSSLGDADYYPNGGDIQAGCGSDALGTCSHSRAYEFLAEAIDSGSSFTATKCNSYEDFTAGKCAGNQKVKMAELTVNKAALGDFYLNTNPDPPFARG